MPIDFSINLPRLTQLEMQQLDYQVMAQVFASHSDLGCLCDERVYRADLVSRLSTAGLGPVLQEQPIELSHAGFRTRYWVDLVVANRAIYELKAVAAIVGEHRAQLLNYLLLTNTTRGKVINFRPRLAESYFVNTTLDELERRRIEIDDSQWIPLRGEDGDLKQLVMELVSDWGLFLELGLYERAILDFLGGEERVVFQLPMSRDGIALGDQRFTLISPDVAFRLSAFTRNRSEFKAHLDRLLQRSPLRAMQWVNLNRHVVELVTMNRDSSL